MRILISVLLFVLSLSCLSAQDILTKVRSVPDYRFRDSDYVTVFDSTNLVIDNNGLNTKRTHILYKIYKKSAVSKFRNITIDFDSLYSSAEFTKLNIWKKSGKCLSYKLNNINAYPSPDCSLYFPTSRISLEISNLEVGDSIEIEYIKIGYKNALLGFSDSFIKPLNDYFYEIISFRSDTPVIHKYYSILYPDKMDIKYEIVNSNEISAAVVKANNCTKYSFVYNNIIPSINSDKMHEFSSEFPHVVLSSLLSYNEKSSFISKYAESKKSFQSCLELDKFVSKLLKDSKTEYDSVALLTHWVAENIRTSRYYKINSDKNSSVNSRIIFADRLGNYGDKAGLLVCMLRSAGFESHIALTNVDNNLHSNYESSFNHIVTLVKLKSNYYKLLDPSSHSFSRELWPFEQQQQSYLPIIPGGADLQYIPLLPTKDNFIDIKLSNKIDRNGNLKATIVLNTDGQVDSEFRQIFINSFKSNWNNIAETLLRKTDTRILMDSLSYSDPFDYSKAFNLHAIITIPSYLLIGKDEMVYNSLATKLFVDTYSHLQKNTSISSLNSKFNDLCPKLIRINETVEFTDNITILYAPKDESQISDIAAFKAAYSATDKVLNLDLDINLSKRIYNKEDWPFYKNCVNLHREFINSPVILKFNKDE